MTGILDTGVSGLLTSQQRLVNTSHNIANASTPGYSRQRVEVVAQYPDNHSGYGIGTGAAVSSIERYHDTFLTSELRYVQSEQSRLDTLHNLASLVDDVLADSDGGITPALQNFFNAVQDVSDDPASPAARIALLDQADALSQRFNYIDRRFAEQDRQVSERTHEIVADINNMIVNIDGINNDIVAAAATGINTPPPDLLDKRDQLLYELSELIDIQVLDNANGTVNVHIGQGHTLLNANTVSQLRTEPDPANPMQERIMFDGIIPDIDVTNSLSGGQLGGVLDFRTQMLDGARNQLGLIATGVATLFNEQHQQGMTLNGELGGDFFQPTQPVTVPHNNNTGTATITANISDAAALTAKNYQLSFDGVNWTAAATDQSSSITGAGPTLSIDGLSIQVSGSAATGDSFLIQPTINGAHDFKLMLNNPDDIAAAGPIRTLEHQNNLGNATVSAGEVSDIADPDLLVSVQLQFNDPPSTFDILDANSGAVLSTNHSFTSGSDININGWRISITGSPQVGDRFNVEANLNGTADNRNMLSLSGLQSKNSLLNGTASFQETYSTLVADVGSRTRYAEINRDAQASLHSTLQARRESNAGVNLDEEAANLIRFQQAYEASARVISTANTIFQTLLNSF